MEDPTAYSSEPSATVADADKTCGPNVPEKSAEKLFLQMSKCITFLGYKEDRFFSNLRLALASLACCVAAYACFFLPPLAEPKHLRVSVVAFFGTLLLLLVVESIYVKNAIACFKNKKGKSFFIDSHLDRRSQDLILAIRQKNNSLSVNSNVGKFFDSHGYLLIDTVYEHTCRLLQDFERGITDANKSEYASVAKKKKKAS